VLDAVLGGTFFAPWPGQDGLRDDLAPRLAEAADYEAQLDRLRAWAKEWKFRIGVHHLRALITADEAGAQYADVAGAVLGAIWPLVVDQFAVKHGPPPGRGAMVLGMGSLGARRLNAASDLDLIVIYDPLDQDNSDGPRPLATRPYFARLTQALVTALSAPMAEGRLYEVDMRLRPSGRQGPVATALTAFVDYQQTEAWTWEHLALTRARVIVGDAGLGADIETFRRSLLVEKGQGQDVLADVVDMRRRIAAARSADDLWDAKSGAGRLQDIALFAQTVALKAGAPVGEVPAQLASGVADGWLDAADAQALAETDVLFWKLQAAAQLLAGGTMNLDTLGEGARRLILRETGCSTISGVLDKLAKAQHRADRIIGRYLEHP
jgi:glutamate-ammonia-ligase adenylyltransferase